MPRLARVVVPGIPHHVTQRGDRRMATFLCEERYQVYLDLMAEWCDERGVDVWAYCLMPNHVHIVAVPAMEQSLRLGIGEAHRYACAPAGSTPSVGVRSVDEATLLSTRTRTARRHQPMRTQWP